MIAQKVTPNSKGDILLAFEVGKKRVEITHTAQDIAEGSYATILADVAQDGVEDMLANILDYFESGPKMLSLEKLTQDINWVETLKLIESPTPIMAEDGIEIGRIGLGKEELSLGVYFISPDNTYATLTMFDISNLKSKEGAVEDLKRIAAMLHGVANSIEANKNIGE